MKIEVLDKGKVSETDSSDGMDFPISPKSSTNDDEDEDKPTEGGMSILDEERVSYRGNKKAGIIGKIKKDEVLTTDPFRVTYNPTDGYTEKALWFVELVKNIHGNYHIRRIHYQTIGKLKPNGIEYINTKGDGQYLQNASMYARYLGYIPWDRIVDNKNMGLVFSGPYNEDIIETDIENKNDLIKKEIEFYNQILDFGEGRIDFNNQNRQPFHLEIWCEKSTINDILLPICSRYGASLAVASGQLSVTLIKDSYEKMKELKKPVIIFYLRDFDPAGESMPIAGARKMEWFVRLGDKNIISLSNESVKLIDLALTYDQCVFYNLPRQPMSDKKAAYKASFEEKFGKGAIELDSFIALHEVEFKKLLDDALSKYYDIELEDEIKKHNKDEQKRFDDYKKDIFDKIISTEKDYFEQSIGKYNKKILELNEIGKSINNTIDKTKRELKIEEFVVKDPPKSKLVIQEDDNDYTLDTTRSYNKQLDRYELIQGKMKKLKEKLKIKEDKFEEDTVEEFDGL